MDSLYRYPWHLQRGLRSSVDNFLQEEFWSYNDESSASRDGQEIMEDRNIYSGKRYKNVFDCRQTKSKFLLEDMPQKVKYYILLKYEELRDNYEQTVEKLRKNFKLTPSAKYISTVEQYKDIKGQKFKPRTDYLISKEQVYQHPDFDPKLEAKLGYP